MKTIIEKMEDEMAEQYQGKWEQRWHPLRREWIVYAAHRNSRPWSGESAEVPEVAPPYDPTCYLCPGNLRVHGNRNPAYEDVYVFENDHPVVGMNAPQIEPQIEDAKTHRFNDLYKKKRASGIAKVVCFDPRHDLSLAEMPLEKVQRVFEVWQSEMLDFSSNPDIHSVLIFENKGKAVGVSNPHPHGQIYALNYPLYIVEGEMNAAALYHQEAGQHLFADILAAEQSEQVRIIAENEHAIAFVPFFARYAYEVMVFPKTRHATLISMPLDALHGLAAVYHEVLRRYDALFQMPFPYIMSLLQAPVDGAEYEDYHLHILLQPPLRQPNLIKFLAGPEIGAGNFMADTLPEEKANELKALVLD
jgi:UDPglucose--hexose-1-phosphate uridylyltransferase